MRREVAVQYLVKRADHLARRIAEAEAVGRALTWDRLELAALRISASPTSSGRAPEQRER